MIPLEPPTFLELIGIGDTPLAAGAWLQQTLAGKDRLLWWVLGVDDLDETARRRGLPIQVGTMAMALGITTTFRTAGMPRYPLPFFVDYSGTPAARIELWKARFAEAHHDCAPGTFAFVEVREPADYLDAWLGDHELPLHHTATPGRGIASVGIATADGDIVLE